MMNLHTLNATAHEHPALLARLLRCASPGDSLLLIENGVYNVADPATLATINTAGVKVYYLQADAGARGLVHDTKTDIHAVDDDGFVALSCSHNNVISWFP